MSSSSREAKARLRQQVRARLRALSPVQRAAASTRAAALLEQQEPWRTARSILFYAPLPEELDLWPLLNDSVAAGKTVALPRFEPAGRHYVAAQVRDPARDLKRGQLGIREPVDSCLELPLDGVELVLVPGLAFDARGGRLGRGKGFYDRLLALVRGTTCGVAFDEQVVDEIPVDSHDVRVQCLLTPTRWLVASD
jgi:5-formyltetrahydrofolate cyclo-ligase